MKPGESEKKVDPVLTKEQTDYVLPLLKGRIPVDDGPGCFLCKWIHEDLEKNGSLTDYPKGSQGGQFPASGKYRHLQLEGMVK